MIAQKLSKMKWIYGLLLNCMALLTVGGLLHSPITMSNLTELRVGMALQDFNQALGKSMSEQGYRLGAMMVGCFSSSINYTSDDKGFYGPGGPWRDGYVLSPKSTWSKGYRIEELPADRPPAVGNPLLNVWIIEDQSLWVWHDNTGIVTHIIRMPVKTNGGVEEKIERMKRFYNIFGWRGLLHACEMEF